MRGLDDLEAALRRIDGRGYPAYRDLQGAWSLGCGCEIYLDHVQADPFASPSKVRVRVSGDGACVPGDLLATRERRVALADWITRGIAGRLAEVADSATGSGRSGEVTIDAGGQEVLERTAVVFGEGWAEARLRVGLPARGRTVLGREALHLLTGTLGGTVAGGLRWDRLDQADGRSFVAAVENWHAVQCQLAPMGLVAFVADGSVLPRASGVSDRPMAPGEAVAFQSPDPMRVSVEIPHPVDGRTRVTGMGIRHGVTLVVGGGYHGKSTLLRALERGVYPHVPGDGRELVVTDASAVKVRAEDGRRVEAVDISAFIGDLPFGRSTRAFSTPDASGSTSQAASTVEAVEAGARVLLLDEDTCAANFMVRDARMQALVHPDREPITPFADRVRELWESLRVSTVLVMGGCGDYFDAADQVVAMHDFLPSDATAEAKAVAAAHPTGRAREATGSLTKPPARAPAPGSIDASRGRRPAKIEARGTTGLAIGDHHVDLSAVGQLVDPSQVRMIGFALHFAATHLVDGQLTIPDLLDALSSVVDSGGLDALAPQARPGEHPGELARARPAETAAALNRLRSLRVVRAGGGSG